MGHSIDFFKDEIRNGFYIPTAIKQAWAADLDVPAEIDRICKKHDIKYFADWGTFLGAVRHAGYVPWDDDLDICMLRDDYIKFRSVADEELPPGGWIILVGNPYSDMTFSRDIWWQLLRKQMSVYGILNSSFRQEPYYDEKMDDWNYVLKRIKEGRIKPSKLISHRLELKELEIGLRIMRDKTEDYCKVMIDTDGTN